MGVELGRDRTAYIHLTLVPYIAASSEIKTKPTQHSVKELRSIGIQPDILVCRSEQVLPSEQRAKIALFTNVEQRAVISAVDVDDLYKIPLMLHAQGLDEIVVDRLRLDVPPAALSKWQSVVDAKAKPEGEVDIAMVGKYVDLRDSYISLTEALLHAGIQTRTRVNIHYVEAQDLERDGTDCLKDVDAILVPGGFGERGIEGKIQSVKVAREKQIPYLGICLGLQVAVIEFSRNVAKLPGAHSTEFRPRHPASGHRADNRVAGPIGLHRGAQRRLRSRRDDAARRADVPLDAGQPGARHLQRRHHPRAPPPSLRVQQQLHGPARGPGAGLLGALR